MGEYYIDAVRDILLVRLAGGFKGGPEAGALLNEVRGFERFGSFRCVLNFSKAGELDQEFFGACMELKTELLSHGVIVAFVPNQPFREFVLGGGLSAKTEEFQTEDEAIAWLKAQPLAEMSVAPPLVYGGGWELRESFTNPRARLIGFICVIAALSAVGCAWFAHDSYAPDSLAWLKYAGIALGLGVLSVGLLVWSFRSPWVKKGGVRTWKELQRGCDPHNLY